MAATGYLPYQSSGRLSQDLITFCAEKQQLAEAQVPATIPPGHRWLRSPGDWPWRAPTAFLMNARRYSINGIERLSNDLALQLAEALGLGGGNAEAADQPAENPAI